MFGGHRLHRCEPSAQSPIPPFVVVIQVSNPCCEFVRNVKNRDTGPSQHGQPRIGSPRPRPQECDGFVAAVPLCDDLRGLGVGAGGRHHQRSHLIILGHKRHDRRKIVAVGKSCYIRWVGGPPKPLENAVDAIACVVGQWREVKTRLSAHVGGQAADSPGVRHHGNPRVWWPLAPGQHVGHLEQVVVILHANHAVLFKCRIVPCVHSGQGCRVRPRGPGTQVRAPNLDEDDGFSALGCQLRQLYEFPSVFEPFHKSGDHLRIVVVQQIAGKITKIQISLVPGGHDVTEPNPIVHRPREKRPKRRCAALANQPHRPAEPFRSARRSTGPDVVLQVGQSQAVRAAHPHLRFPGESTQLQLQLPPVVFASFGKPGRNHDGRPGAPGVALSQRIQHRVIRDHDAHHVRRLGQICYRRI